MYLKVTNQEIKRSYDTLTPHLTRRKPKKEGAMSKMKERERVRESFIHLSIRKKKTLLLINNGNSMLRREKGFP